MKKSNLKYFKKYKILLNAGVIRNFRDSQVVEIFKNLTYFLLF